MFSVFILLTTFNLLAQSLPIVDKGVFVITGVKTCGGGGGYCVLGGDCLVDKEFSPDSNGGHCDGLRKAFTPRAYFVCCEYVETTTTTTTTTTTPASTVDPAINSDEVASPENDDSSSPESKESTSVESNEEDDKMKNNKTTTKTTTASTTAIPMTTPGLLLSTVTTNPGVDFNDNVLTLEEETTTTDKISSDSHTKPNYSTDKDDSNNNNVVINNSNSPIETVKIVPSGSTTVINNLSENSNVPEIQNDESVSGVVKNEDKVMMTTEASPAVQTQTQVSSVSSSGAAATTTIENNPGKLSPETTIMSQGSVLGGETTPVEGIREKEHPTTTVSYSEKTEISMEQSVSLHVKQCGVKLQSSRIDSPRLATQTSSKVENCWTGALVRSPTTMSMSDPGSFVCAGALIHPSVLLTTATCVSRLFAQDLSLFKVALGSNHLLHPVNGPTPDADYRDIKELVIHEDYVVDGHLRINDIALVMLSDPADMTRVCTLCLPDEKTDFTGRDCIVTGYSHPSDSSAMESDGILHEADQRIEFQSNCETVLTNFTQHSFRTEKDLNGLLCASGKYSAEACFSPRDAGSPLACSENGIYVLAGAFSSGFHCGTQDSPVAYTNISNYVLWILKNISR